MYDTIFNILLWVVTGLLVIFLLWIASPGKPHYIRAVDNSCLRVYDGGRWPVSVVRNHYCE